MVFRDALISRDAASALLTRWVGRDCTCLAMHPLHGGMIHSVVKLEFDREPYFAVVKINSGDENPFRAEYSALAHLRKHTKFPTPEPYLCVEKGDAIDKHCLLIECLPGVNMGDAEMSLSDKEEVEEQMAEILLELHSHHREDFGTLDASERSENWLGYFKPVILENLSKCQERLPQMTYTASAALISQMQDWFEPQGQPSLVHGDIWVTNVMVVRDSGWRIVGFVDPSSIFADIEYELAYLEVFRTAGHAFFRRYTRDIPLRPGYPVRRLYYWLNTMLVHVWHFGDRHYVDRTQSIVGQLTTLTTQSRAQRAWDLN